MLPPKWIGANAYLSYKEAYFEEFDKKFSELTGIPVKELNQDSSQNGNPTLFEYWIKDYNAKTSSWHGHLKLKDCFKGNTHTSQGESCEKLLKEYYKVVRGQQEKNLEGQFLDRRTP